MNRQFLTIFLFLLGSIGVSTPACASVKPGIEVLLSEANISLLKGKRIGLLTNHTAVNNQMVTSVNLLKAAAQANDFTITALFAPEHGITGASHADESVKDETDPDGIPIFSLHGTTQRPTLAMLKNVDVLIYDIQDIGARSYTYITTLFYSMEEAAKAKIPLIVVDRPNPINGITVDGPMLEDKWRSIVGYINVPYCYGMTIGELARYFNEEYHVGCKLKVIPMEGWKRKMSFADTGLPWVPTSPHIPESTTPLYYPMTGILGELQLVNIGVGYTLPFKLIGAPWIHAQKLAVQLNQQKLPGVLFQPFYYKPFYGKFTQQPCQGVIIHVTDPIKYKPVTTQYVIIALLKSLYPKQFQKALEASSHRKDMFCKVNGTEDIYTILHQKQYFAWEVRDFHRQEREPFLKKREKYLLAEYK